MDLRRVAAGAAAPVVFIGAWAVLGAQADGYSPIDDPISRLAAQGAPTQAAMTGALVAYAVGVGTYATELRRVVSTPVGVAAALNALGTLGVAATPLDSRLGGMPHAVAAGLSYAALASLPVLAARARTSPMGGAVRVGSVALGAASGAALLMSVVGSAHTGFWQRLGLTIGDVWLIGSAAHLARRRRR